jgi:hypothetical protein
MDNQMADIGARAAVRGQFELSLRGDLGYYSICKKAHENRWRSKDR